VPACPPCGLADGVDGGDSALLVAKDLVLTQISGVGDGRCRSARLVHDILPVLSLDGCGPCRMSGEDIEENSRKVLGHSMMKPWYRRLKRKRSETHTKRLSLGLLFAAFTFHAQHLK